MRIGIDCDGVLRDLILCIKDSIKETHPEYADKILAVETWDWVDWLPFWTNEEAEKYIFEDNYVDFFGVDCPPIKEAVEDWNKLREWADEHGHKLILVSAQRKNCEELTEAWLQRWGFMGFDDIHFTHNKWAADVDVLVDDSPEKLKMFKEKSINNGQPICFKQTWNRDCQKDMITIDRLSDLMTRCYG